MHWTFPTLLLFLYSPPLSWAGIVGEGGACSQGNNRLQIGTYQFATDCNSVTYCNDQGICVPKGCRKDDFPFGYGPNHPPPPKCEKGTFCPDEGSECMPQIDVGNPCQLNRDDQCVAPPNFQELADKSGRGLNFNGSVCLNNICMFANENVGSPCVVENTRYIGYSPTGEFNDIVSRGNCKIGLYCDSQSLVCMENKVLGASCSADKECDSYNCLLSGVCGLAAATPRQFGVWVYILVALGIIGGMAGTLTGLFITHRKQRDIEREKRAQYWREQNAFHHNLVQMRETARAFIMTLPNGGKGDLGRDFSDDTSTPMLQSGGKGSGLRNYMADDSSDFDDGGPVEMPKPDHRRF